MARHMLVTALLTTHSCHALRQPPRMQALLETQSSKALRQPPQAVRRRAAAAPSLARQPPRPQAIHRRATAAPALAFLAALATPAAKALPPPEGCVSDAARIIPFRRRQRRRRRQFTQVWTGEGEYPGRKSGQDVKLINANLDCNENFVKGFGVSEFIVTPAILGLAAVLANIRKEE